MVRLVDDGSDIFTEDLRVSPSERGKGISHLISVISLFSLKNKVPKLKFIRSTTWESSPSAKVKEFRLLHSKAVLSIIFKAEEVREITDALISRMESTEQRFKTPVILEPEEVMKVFQNEKVIEKLLPARMLIQNWFAALPMKSNLEYLLSKGIIWMADNIEEPTFLSLGTPPFRAPLDNNTYEFQIDLYGTDQNSSKMHFISQLLLLSKGLSEGQVICFVFMEKPLFQTMDFFCKDFKRFEFMKEQLILEENLSFDTSKL